MIINVTNCGDCIFRNHSVDFDSLGYDTVDTCGLIDKLIRKYTLIAVYDSNQEEEVPQLKTVLDECPLKKEEIIVNLEK